MKNQGKNLIIAALAVALVAAVVKIVKSEPEPQSWLATVINKKFIVIFIASIIASIIGSILISLF